MQAKISLIDLVNALEAATHGLEWRVDLVTGDFLPCEEGSPCPEASERFRMLPANGARRETEIRRTFCATLTDEATRSALSDAVESREFLVATRRAGLHDEWLVHRRWKLTEIALEWADAENVGCRHDQHAMRFAAL